MTAGAEISGLDITTIEASEKIIKIVGRERLRQLKRRGNAPGLVFLAGHLGLLTITGVLLWLSLPTGWAIAAGFAHGVVISHLFAPLHECSHRTAFRSRWLNEGVYWACGLVLGLTPLAFRYQHADHHAYTQNAERDPQMIAVAEKFGGFLYYATAIPYFIEILRMLGGYALGRFNPTDRRAFPARDLPIVQRQARVFLCVYSAVAALSIWFETPAALIYWLLPRIAGETVERMIRMSEHVGCSRTPDMLENSRTVYAWAPFRWLSRNMPLHTAHRAVPQVPFHAVPALNEILSDRLKEVRNGYTASIAAMIRNALAGGRG
jgi:fatty acid desaturase